MKKTLTLLGLTLVILIAYSMSGRTKIYGNGKITTENRQTEKFHSLEVSGAYDIVINNQKEHEISITSDSNIVPLITTEIQKGRLHIDSKNNLKPSKKIFIAISALKIDKIDISGAIDLKSNDINSKKLKIDASGASKIILNGLCEKLSIDISGASKIFAKDLICEQVKIDSSGSSKIGIHAKEKLKMDLSGASSVTYYGKPKKIEQKTSGACRIISGH